MKALSLIALGAATLVGCSNSSVGPSAGQSQVSLSFTTAAAPTPAAMVVSGDVTVADAQNTLVITSAEVVLRDIELWRVGAQDCVGTLDDDSCEKFQTGPTLLNLPLDGSVSQSLSVAIDAGTYDRIEFDIHKVSNNDPEDADFRAAHPDLLDTSIRISGQYNGTDFTYVTDLNESQRFNLVPQLVIDSLTTSTNVTVRLDLDRWFRDGAGNVIDPATANKGGVNENMVRDNIRNSIEGFEDRDRDGRDDS